MPNRIIKESICYSDDIDQLTAFEETVFYRLIVNVDDYGRIDARPNFLRSKLFATKQGITDKSINDALPRLASVGLVRLYEVDGKPLLLLPKWNSHQRIRNTKEKYPAPTSEEDFLPQPAASCGELRPESNPNPESESNPNPNPESNARAREGWFDEFWNIYPRKADKKKAKQAWFKIKDLDESLFEDILAGLERAMRDEQWTKDGGKYIPHPTTWINGERWTDESSVMAYTPPEKVPKNDFLSQLYIAATMEKG